MLIAKKERFNLILNNVLTYHPEYMVVIDQKRDTRILKVNRKAVAKTNSEINKTGKLGKMDPFGLGIILAVKNAFTRYLAHHIDELEPDETGEYTFKKVKQLNGPVYTSRIIYEEIPDTDDFYIVDLRHAYWRIALLKGYIGEKLYETHNLNPERKQMRNIALACMIAHKKRLYYINGKPELEITEACKPFETMYGNIRRTCYNAMGDVLRALPYQVFAYRTDAVFVTADGLEKAKKMLYNRGFLCRIIKCTKISNTFYTDDTDVVKKF